MGYGEKRQSFHDIVSGEIHHIKGLTDNIKIAVEKAEQEAKTTIDTIVVNCFVGIPSLFSYKINHIRKHPDAPIDLEELDTIISETQYNGLQSSLQQLESHLGITKQDIEVCVSDISGIHIDGKSYHNPLKHQGKNIKFDITQIFAKRTDILTINTIGNIIGKNIIKIIPENYAISKLWEPEE
ncbi:MAG: hypothetical protein H6767_08385 [Candidatus Peribacteria bacterium]|nr:MAG: hypothetical protein H6767_08385 [Candidatus Peribacteria bacterium]